MQDIIQWNIFCNRTETVQTADSQVEPQYYAKCGGVLCLPRHGEQRSQVEGSGGDRPVRKQTLPYSISGRWLPISRSLFVLSREGGSS